MFNHVNVRKENKDRGEQLVMAEIDVKFMKGNKQTVKAMQKTYKEQKPKPAVKTGKKK